MQFFMISLCFSTFNIRYTSKLSSFFFFTKILCLNKSTNSSALIKKNLWNFTCFLLNIYFKIPEVLQITNRSCWISTYCFLSSLYCFTFQMLWRPAADCSGKLKPDDQILCVVHLPRLFSSSSKRWRSGKILAESMLSFSQMRK